jgi:cellulose biosynthesis protein BcsQ
MKTTFDTSLRTLIDGLLTSLTADEIQNGLVLRDSSGRLAFFARDEIPEQRRAALESSLRASLGAYLRDDMPIADASTPGVEPLLNDPSALQLVEGELSIRLLDRRIVGADWVRGPSPQIVDDEPRRIVFASLKGGVGRSTAISVVAADAARRGRNVLVIDLDLEAPGIGSLLLDANRTPAFGTLDYLVETALQDLDDRELDEFVGTSTLTDGAGLVHVIPVVGTKTKETPANYMAKLSRAMTEVVKTDTIIPVRDRLRAMVDRFAARQTYDLVLVDARAGMSELTAGPLLALGASTVFLFATAQQQSVESYRLLFAHLASLVPGPPSPWHAFQMVHAKATLDDNTHQWLADELLDLFAEYLYEEAEGTEVFNFQPGDPGAPHMPVPILFDAKFVLWDPVRTPTQLSQNVYNATFGPLLARIEQL